MHKTPGTGSAKTAGKAADMWRIGKALAVVAALLVAPALAQEAEPALPEKPPAKECPPDVGCVTNLPLPRFVSLKSSEGNARRGPALTHRIDWVFTRAGMPLKVTAEYENWRRVEDAEGAGGWVHYTLLSGARTALVTLDMAEFHHAPNDNSTVVAQAEVGVVGRILDCSIDWCRLALDGQRGWVRKTSIWGVAPDETIE